MNGFVDVKALVGLIESRTHSRCVFQQVLHSGFTFMNRTGNPQLPRRVWALGGGLEFPLAAATLMFRVADRLLGTRISVYGWCLVFQRRPQGLVDVAVGASNPTVCIRCGAGHVVSSLAGLVKAFCGIRWYRCPRCAGFNFLTGEARAEVELAAGK